MRWRHNTLNTVMVLGPAVFVFAFALDIYIPVIPQLHHVFHASQEQLQLTLSLFMLTIAIGQLLFGPLSDQIGRLKPAMGAAVIMCIGTVLCATAHQITTLYLGRIIQAFGCCGLLVTAYAIVRDAFCGNDSARIYAYLNCFVSISPLFAPLIGGYLDYYFGWRAVFWGLLVLGFVTLLITSLLYHESHDLANRKALGWDIFKRYAQILSNQDFFFYTLSASLSITVYFTFFSVSPYIIITLLHVASQHFGIYFSVLGVTLIIGSLICGSLVQRLGVSKTLVLGATCILIGGGSMTLWYLTLGLSLAGFLIPFAIAGLGAALAIGAGQGGAMEPFPATAGAAAALFGAIEFTCCGIGGFIVLHWPIHSPLPLSIFYLVIAALTLFHALIHHCLKKAKGL